MKKNRNKPCVPGQQVFSIKEFLLAMNICELLLRAYWLARFPVLTALSVSCCVIKCFGTLCP